MVSSTTRIPEHPIGTGDSRREPVAVPKQLVKGLVVSEYFWLECDELGTVVDASQGARDVLGLNDDELLGQNLVALTPSKLCPVRGPRSVDTLLGHLPDGSAFRFGVANAPFVDQDPPRYGVVLADAGESARFRRTLTASLGEVTADRRAKPTTRSMDRVEQELSRLLVRGVEAELAHASLEIHDGVVQSMTHAIHLLEAFLAFTPTVPDQEERLSRVIAVLRLGIADGRSISRELRPASLERMGLIKTLRSELDDLAQSGVEVDFESHAPDPIGCDTETALYRIASEAMLNVRKHAKASTVTLRIETTGDAVALSIFDDGVGFKRHPIAGDQCGLGLGSMWARARFLGGTFSLVSVPRKGTLIRVTFPAGVSIGEPPCR